MKNHYIIQEYDNINSPEPGMQRIPPFNVNKQRIYGKPSNSDSEGVRNCLNNWADDTAFRRKDGTRSPTAGKEIDFVRTNRKALLAGATTAKAIKQFRADHNKLYKEPKFLNFEEAKMRKQIGDKIVYDPKPAKKNSATVAKCISFSYRDQWVRAYWAEEQKRKQKKREFAERVRKLTEEVRQKYLERAENLRQRREKVSRLDDDDVEVTRQSFPVNKKYKKVQPALNTFKSDSARQKSFEKEGLEIARTSSEPVSVELEFPQQKKPIKLILQ